MNNNEKIHENWNDLKTRIKETWNKFSDTELESFKGKLELISEKIQKAYGYTKERADLEYQQFLKKGAPMAAAAPLAAAASTEGTTQQANDKPVPPLPKPISIKSA